VAFIALTGHDAFANSTSKESLIARLTSRPRRLDEVRSDLDWPSSLQQVFDRALAPDPVDRFETVAEFGLTLGSAVMEMTPTQTAEIYRHALGQRMVSVASLTPNDMRRVGTPAAGMATSKLQASAPPPKRRADPVGVRRRPSVMPYVLLLGIATWGTWWYGAQQPAGTARAASDAIAHYAGAARALVRGVIDRTPASAAAPATTPPPPARRATTKRRTNATPSVADTSAPPPPDTNQASADSLIPQ
jgi:serine/threonine-protein kinase